MLQRSLNSFVQKFGFTKRQTRDALSRLKELGLVVTELRTVKIGDAIFGNVLFIAPVPKKLKKFELELNIKAGKDIQ